MIRDDRGLRLGALDPATAAHPYWRSEPGLLEAALAAEVDVSRPPARIWFAVEAVPVPLGGDPLWPMPAYPSFVRVQPGSPSGEEPARPYLVGKDGARVYLAVSMEDMAGGLPPPGIPLGWIASVNDLDPLTFRFDVRPPDGTAWSKLPSGARFNGALLDPKRQTTVTWEKNLDGSISKTVYTPDPATWLKWTALGIIALVTVAMAVSIAAPAAAAAGGGGGGGAAAGGGATAAAGGGAAAATGTAAAGTAGTSALIAGAGKAAAAIAVAVGTKKVNDALAPSKPGAQPVAGGNANPEPLQAGLLGGGTGTMIAIGGGLLVALLLLGGGRRR